MRLARRASVLAAVSLVLTMNPWTAQAAENTALDGAGPETTGTFVAAGSHGPAQISVATVDAGLTEAEPGALTNRLQGGGDQQAQELAASVQSARPDVLVVTGMDVEGEDGAVEELRTDYLGHGQDGRSPINYPYVFAAQTNAGTPSGADLDGDGTVGSPSDALGYGAFQGQNSMVVFSRVPIDTQAARTFNHLLWSQTPGASMPDSYSGLVSKALPLQSTSLWDLPLSVGGQRLHLLATSATPTSGDGADPSRHADQLGFLRRYVQGDAALTRVKDDQGRSGGLAQGDQFVLAGSLGADDQTGAGSHAVSKLLESPDLCDDAPTWDNVTGPAADRPMLDPLSRLLFSGARATRVGDGPSGRLDYVVRGCGVRAEQTSMSAPSIEGQSDTASRLVVLRVGVPSGD